MNILDDTGNGLVLVDDAINTKTPDGGTAQRRKQHPSHCIAEGMAKAALEWL